MQSYKFFYIIQSLLKYIPFQFFAKVRPVVYRPFFKSIGKGVQIQDNVLFKFPADISIGHHVQIAQGCIFVGKSGLKIGNDVLVGAGTKIITSSHNYDNLDVPIRLQGLTFKPVGINDDVWFGFNCVVLGGTIIGKGSIIAANAVIVEGVVENYSVMGGVPAKLIKKRK